MSLHLLEVKILTKH